QVGFRLANLRSSLRFSGVSGEEFALQICEIALRLLEVSALPCPSRGKCCELLDSFFRQVDSRSQRGFFARCIVKLMVCSLERGFGGSLRRLERHGVDLEKHITFLDRPVWFDRHLRYLAGHPRHDRDYIILRPDIG